MVGYIVGFDGTWWCNARWGAKWVWLTFGG